MWSECQRPVVLTGILTINQAQHNGGAGLERKAGSCSQCLLVGVIPLASRCKDCWAGAPAMMCLTSNHAGMIEMEQVTSEMQHALLSVPGCLEALSRCRGW